MQDTERYRYLTLEIVEEGALMDSYKIGNIVEGNARN